MNNKYENIEKKKFNLKNDVIFKAFFGKKGNEKYLIDDTDWGKIEMAEKKNEKIKSALDDMEYLTGDEELQRLAELRESSAIDRGLAMSYARKQGIKEGEKIGIKENQIETARKLLKKNVSIDIILEVTGLTKEELEKIKVNDK
ncbi:MAG: hypothetical protein UIT70_07865 [Clostridia bacterium]|nr:hypothetical protein [Clostridia bacterium]